MVIRNILRFFDFKKKKPDLNLGGINLLIQTGELEEALDAIVKLENEDSLDETNKIKVQILKSEVLTQRGTLEESLKLAEQAMRESQRLGIPLLAVDAIISLSTALFTGGRLDKCLEMITEGEKLLETIENVQPSELDARASSLKYVKGGIHRKKGDLDTALEYLQESFTIRQKLGNIHEIADSFNQIGIIHVTKGDLDLGLTYLKQSLSMFEDIGNKQSTSKILNNIGQIYRAKGELEQALEYYHRSLAVFEELENKQNIAISILNIGQIFMQKWELNSALNYFQRSLTLFEELENNHGMVHVLSNIGVINQNKGELDVALEFYQKCLPICEKLGDKRQIAIILNNIGDTYNEKGDYTTTLDYMKKSLEAFESIGSRLETCQLLDHLANVSVHAGLIDKAQSYLQKLQVIKDKEKNKLIDQCYRLSKAVILKTSSRVMKKAEAQEILQQIVKEDVIEYELTIRAILNLCELLLLELRITGYQEVLDELKELLGRLLKIAEKENSYTRLAHTYMLQSKTALLELDVKLAKQLLTQAQQIAEQKGLKSLAIMASIEHDALLDQLTQWNEFIEHNASISDRLELTELEGVVSQMIQKKAGQAPELPQEKPTVLLILGGTGISVFSKKFHLDDSLEDQLIGGFLTAINNFMREAFSVTGSIERIKHEDNIILMKNVESFLFCYAFKGQSYSAMQKLDKFIEDLNSKNIWKALTKASEYGVFGPELDTVDELAAEIFLS
ncbi:MAG: tetratricopeptide repeat protein [Candidatus Odinarchaeota archaeon]